MRYLIVIIAVSLFACTKEEITPRDYPRVMTRDAANISVSSATFVGEITYASTAIVDYGFIWTATGFPTLTNTNALKKSFGSKAAAGVFDFTISQGLQAGKKYSVCAYAKSAKDIVYGKTVEFTSK